MGVEGKMRKKNGVFPLLGLTSFTLRMKPLTHTQKKFSGKGKNNPSTMECAQGVCAAKGKKVLYMRMYFYHRQRDCPRDEKAVVVNIFPVYLIISKYFLDT